MNATSGAQSSPAQPSAVLVLEQSGRVPHRDLQWEQILQCLLQFDVLKALWSWEDRIGLADGDANRRPAHQADDVRKACDVIQK
jgi:hypothetical protein